MINTKQANMKRTDIHSPSQIIPEDYYFIAFDYVKIDGLGDALFLQQERKIKQAHFDKTGGKYSSHYHGGNCMCCGSVNAVYTCTFYHEKTNSYIRVGNICADKLQMSYDDGQFNLFKKQCREALKIAKGKARAKDIVKEHGLERAWEINESVNQAWADKRFNDVKYEERILNDIMGKLIRYGNPSEKQINFLKSLVQKIDSREDIERKRAEERANAAECPNGKLRFKGTLISRKVQDGFYGSQLKILVKHETGFMAWGTCPDGLRDAERGASVEFNATFAPSKNDPKFGFFKRPTKPSFTQPATETTDTEIAMTEVNV